MFNTQRGKGGGKSSSAFVELGMIFFVEGWGNTVAYTGYFQGGCFNIACMQAVML